MMTNTKRIEALETRMTSIESKLDQILNAMSTQQEKTKVTKQQTKKSQAKPAQKSTKVEVEFDRAEYEKVAKKLGVYSTKHNKVVATVKDGKVVSTREQNRQKVYAAMGINK